MALGAASGVAVLAFAGATPASAAPKAAVHGAKAKTIDSQDLQSFLTKVTSSTGVKLYVSFEAFRDPGYPAADSAGVVLDTTSEREGHSWQFLIGKSALTTKASGAGSLKTGSTFGSYGGVSVTFTPTASKRIQVCNASNYTLEQTERVRGKLHLVTHSTGRHAWGTVGSATRFFSFAGQTDLYTYYSSSSGCTPKTTKSACYNSVYWTNTNKSVVFSGSAGDGPSAIYASRQVNLSAPKGAMRSDFVFTKAPAPVLSTSGTAATMKVTTSGNGLRGSGTIKGTHPTINRSTCKGGTETQTLWSDATFTPGSSTLRATEQIFGTITLPTTKRTFQIERDKG